MKNQQNNHKIFLYLLVIFLAAFVGSGIFLAVNSKKINGNEKNMPPAKTEPESKISPTPMPTRGSINFKNSSTVNKVSTPLELSLLMDSDGENVTAFDTIINYDPINFDFVKANSLNQDFKVYSYKRDNRLSLTVVKTGQNATTVFKGSAVIKLVFQPKVKGSFTFTVLPSFEKETSKFVNEKTEIIYPNTDKIKVSVN